jgi:hypothetical protein
VQRGSFSSKATEDRILAATMTSVLTRLANEVLSSIEILEAQLLNWGFVSGSLDLRAALPDILDGLTGETKTLWLEAQQEGITADAVLKNINVRKLAVRLSNGNYRSRFAETIRLTYLLRQRFSEEDWLTAPRLVADLRLDMQRRRYPKYNVPLSGLEERLEEIALTSLQQQTIRELLKEPNGAYLSLARFQDKAIVQLLTNLDGPRDKGIVIGAGTGAGKTKAFYIPALTHIVEHIDPSQSWLQALAIYPRIELLKDQLAEAYSECRRLDNLLELNGKRPLSLAAYYGGTPKSAEHLKKYSRNLGWSKTSAGYECPFFSCPRGTNHILLWEIGDLEKEILDNQKGHYGKHAVLRCQNCNFETEPGELSLTRESMRREPPDILFTTTEMLNRRMSRVGEHALFGIGQRRPPRLVLLDEIHTYEGITGAQVAYLLRRWRQARGKRSGLCMVGLSATLTQATDFFSRLTGITPHEVDYIYPEDDELLEEGMEYNVVLKGDPVAGTALLSTSVQTAMLVGRILDPMRAAISQGAFGKRIFAFTDKLDAINRWFYIMYDAEVHKRLSKYRLPDGSGPLEQRRQQGQVWDICQHLTYDLEEPLNISRTTSQDPGVSQNTDMVIATSTLEVGFNDPTVGAVIQHKAPRSMASFLQRKGRAGRTRSMRPWTIVVTSAYGRDRWAFQHAEDLFSPVLPSMDLPIDNYYVRKMQAAYTIMDWAANELGREDGTVDIWKLLSSGPNDRWDGLAGRRARLRKLLLRVLDGSNRESFEAYLEAALSLSDPVDLHSVLWGEPRPIYFEVIPTLIRQLETNWRLFGEHGSQSWADNTDRYPMPDFVPTALFSDLNIPEVRIILPAHAHTQQTPDDFREEAMDLAQTLTEFAPGKANKRFVLSYQKDVAHWIALPDQAQLTRGAVNLDLLDIDLDGQQPKRTEVDDISYSVYRPLTYRLGVVPDNVRSTSTAELIWRSSFEPRRKDTAEDGLSAARAIGIPERSMWRRFIENVAAYTRTTGSWVDVTRLAVGVKADTRYQDGHSQIQTLRFEKGDEEAALGFTIAADALEITIEPLDTTALQALDDWKQLYLHLGPAYFQHKLQTDVRLNEAGLSVFAINWLWQLELAMLTATAVARHCSLENAAQEVSANRAAYADRTLKAIFQSQRVEDEDEEQRGRLHAQLLAYLEDEGIRTAIEDASSVLWRDADPSLAAWLGSCYASSIGAAVFAAVTRLVPDIDDDALSMDTDGRAVWISEKTAGGVGLISKIADVIARYPRRFELQLFDTLDYCEREQLAVQLRAVTELLSENDSELKAAFNLARTQSDLPSLVATKRQLAATLESKGIQASRQLFVALNAKFLRPNSGPDSDRLIVTLVKNWEREESRLGTAIDLRTMAVAAPRIDEVKTQLQQMLDHVSGANQDYDEGQIFNLLQSLLWLSCHNSCPDCIEKWQPYKQLPTPSRALLMSLLAPEIDTVTYGTPYWEHKAKKRLETDFLVQVNVRPEEVAVFKESIRHFLTSPIDVGYQRFFPMIERIRRHERRFQVTLVIRELVGG